MGLRAGHTVNQFVSDKKLCFRWRDTQCILHIIWWEISCLLANTSHLRISLGLTALGELRISTSRKIWIIVLFFSFFNFHFTNYHILRSKWSYWWKISICKVKTSSSGVKLPLFWVKIYLYHYIICRSTKNFGKIPSSIDIDMFKIDYAEIFLKYTPFVNTEMLKI